MDFVELIGLLTPGHQLTLVHRLGELNETQRRALWRPLKEWAQSNHDVRFDRGSVAVAILGTAGGVRQAASLLQWQFGAAHFESAATQVLADRKPAWLAQLPDALLREGFGQWQLVRSLVREGLVERPDNPGYYLGMVRSLHWHDRGHHPILAELRADPGLLEHEVWTMLATEQAGRRLAMSDNWAERPAAYAGNADPRPRPEMSWRLALVALADDGTLDRGRLLDAALTAPLRDWAAADVGWFVTLHEALDPTLDEVAARQATYARLLTAAHGPAVKAAQKRLARLVGDSRLEVDPLLDASAATLTRSDKGTVVAQLALLGAIASAHPAAAAAVASVAASASDHPNADVRARVTKLLASLGRTSPPSVEVEFAAPAPRPRPAPRPVVPVRDADELAELFLAQVEAVDPLELERLVDGAVRFAGQSSPAMDEVLRRRIAETEYGSMATVDVALLAQAWVRPAPSRLRGLLRVELPHKTYSFSEAPPPTSLFGAQNHRLREAMHAVLMREAPLLSAPTHHDGSIDPGVLSARVAATDRRVEPRLADVALAVLRVAPAGRDSVVLPPRHRTALAVEQALAELSAHAPQWERLREDHPRRFRFLDPWQVVLFRDRSPARFANELLRTAVHLADPAATSSAVLQCFEYSTRTDELLATVALWLPHHPDALAAHLAPFACLDRTKERSLGTAVHDAVARSAQPPGRPALAVLVLGLAAKDVRARSAAQDALIDLAGHGLLDGTGLGEEAVAHLRDDFVVGKRVADGLAEVARADDAAALPVLAALQALLPALPGRRDAGAFLEPAADLAERTRRRLDLPVEFVELASGRSSSQLARALRRLL